MKSARWMTFVLCLVPALLLAQAQGRVKGVVSDTKGNPIVDARIIITCDEISNFHKELVTDKKGSWATIIADATKRYKFKVEATGYQPIEQVIKPLIGAQTLEVPFTLKSVQELQQMEQQQLMEQPGIKQFREGKDLQAAGKNEEARKKFEEAVQLKPDLYLAWLELGVMELNAGKSSEALADAEKCLLSSPNFAACLALAINASKAKGDKAAEEKYTAAYKLANPTDPTMFYNDAVAFLNKGDDAKAKPLLEKALEADAKYPDALFQLGMLYFRLGDSAKAKELLTKFIEGSPDHKEVPTAKEMLKYM
jgi:tetratricopeptide (TPR) repeat protein